jgi:hypothetical protein
MCELASQTEYKSVESCLRGTVCRNSDSRDNGQMRACADECQLLARRKRVFKTYYMIEVSAFACRKGRKARVMFTKLVKLIATSL